MSYVTLTFLGMLLVQLCFTIPRTDAESPASRYEFNTNNKLYKTTIKTLVKIAIPLIERCSVLLEKV
uniref:Uncharacterized protein n=1 Tax=Glossina austeni TaxID=7395 RepID=A0A1A9VYZ3_GLOAU